mgnify:FL=1
MRVVDFDPGDKWRRSLNRVSDLKPVLKRWGMIGVEASINAFREQSYGGVTWQPRAVPNVYGLIADFDDGRNPPKRRLEARPALVDTGNLKRSISFRTSKDSVTIGTQVKYAARLHEGGPIQSRKITEKVQRRAAKYIAKQTDAMQKRLNFLLSPSLLGETLTGEVEPRPFVGMTPDLEDTFLGIT